MVSVILFTACSDIIQPTATPRIFVPTAATGSGETGGQQSVSLVLASGEGDPVNGESLFVSEACSGCHRTDSETLTGPGMSGIAERAATRKPPLTADEYLTESMKNPSVFLVEGFDALMPEQPNLTDQDIADLIAYLKTIQ